MITFLASIPSPESNGFYIGPVRINYYGIMIAIGVALAWRMIVRRYEARGFDRAVAERLLLWVIIIGFAGARLAYVSTHLSRFEDEWWKVIAIWEGGIALYGGLTAGAITLVVLGRKWGASISDFLDAMAPAVPLAQAVGRWGNYFNQELFGTPSDLPWAVEIDPQHRPDQYAEYETFHPTFLYESLWNFALSAFIIWLDRRYPALRGRLIGVYFMGYSLMRFLLELIRTDTEFRFLGLSRNGWVSIGVFILGAFIVFWKNNVTESLNPEKVLRSQDHALSPEPDSA